MSVCGMDLGSAEDTVFFQDQGWKVAHDVAGWTGLDDRLPADCEIVFEGRCAALESVLGHRSLWSMDPGQSARVMRALQEPKDDARDAQTLVQLRQLRPQLFKRVEPRDPQLQQLRELARVRRSLVKQRTAVLQQLQSRRRRGNTPEKQWLQGFVGTPQEALVEVLKVLHQEIKKVEHQIQQQGAQHSTCARLRTVKGMGPNLSAEITAEMDEFTQLANKGQAQAYAGTAPVTFASGKKKVVKTRRRCNHRARNALYLFAFCSLRFHDWARQYYDACRARGKSHDAALISLANRWVPILLLMARNNEPYDPSRKQLPVQKK